MSWVSRASKNLLPLSLNQSDLRLALREWRYTGNFHDLESPCENCELCDHPDIRYQFEIGNLKTGERLLVGSECINRFGIAATDEEGRTLDSAGTRKKLGRDRRKLLEDARRRRVISALVALAHADAQFDIGSFISYVQERDAFTPKQLAFLFWRLDLHKISHSKPDYKLTIRRDREKAQLLAMNARQISNLFPALSQGQRQFLSRAGRPAAG